MKVGPIVEEPMKAHGLYDKAGREQRARELLEAVGLDPQHYNRHPHQFSGGQRQRINLARTVGRPGLHRLRRADERARRLDPGPGAEHDA